VATVLTVDLATGIDTKALANPVANHQTINGCIILVPEKDQVLKKVVH
jgi:hypothetical protein